jgi:hypothetical protein
MKPLKPVGFVELRNATFLYRKPLYNSEIFADNVINDRSILCILQGKLNSCFF